jgi:hypothetical protein
MGSGESSSAVWSVWDSGVLGSSSLSRLEEVVGSFAVAITAVAVIAVGMIALIVIPIGLAFIAIAVDLVTALH